MRPARTDAVSANGIMVVAATQAVLTLLVVLVSRVNLGGRLHAVSVMALASVNALVVAFALLGVRRGGTIVTLMAVGVVVVVAGLLAWPSWDVAYRMRVF